jgi:hypothetical protein
VIDRLVDQAEIVSLGGESCPAQTETSAGPTDAAYNLAYLSEAS